MEEFIINHLIKLEQVEVDRIGKALQQSEALRREFDHYHYKLQGMERKYKRTKVPNKSMKDSLRRNRNKFKDAKRAYDDHTQDLCLFMEEVIERGWRDLFPVLLKLVQSDLFNVSFEYETLSKLEVMVEKLKSIGDKYQVNLDSRIHKLKLSSPAELCTRLLEIKGRGIPLDVSPTDFEDDIDSIYAGSVFMDNKHSSVGQTKAEMMQGEKDKEKDVDRKERDVMDNEYPLKTDYGENDDYSEESFVQAAIKATERAELYTASMQANNTPVDNKNEEPDIIVESNTDNSDYVTIVSKEEEDDCVQEIHLAPAPTEAA